MVTKGMFWKRFYFVVILLLCNCFLLCSSGSCKWLKEILWGDTTENTEKDSDTTRETINFDNNDNNDELNNYNIGETVDTNKNQDDKNEIDLSGYSMNRENIIQRLKCVFVSDTVSVGKTSILNCLLGKEFDKEPAGTVGYDWLVRQYKVVHRKEEISIGFFDFSGDKNYIKDFPSCLKDANAIIFVYDITNAGSFNKLDEYIEAVQKEAESKAKGCSFFLLGNKLDEVSNGGRQVEKEDALHLAADNNFIFLGECSAKNNTYEPYEPQLQLLYCMHKQCLTEGGKCIEGLRGMLKDIIWSVHKNQNPSTF